MTPAVAKTPGEIRVRGLTRRFGSKVAVQPFAITIGPGGITGLLGPNGSGKSTLLRMLTGLVKPNAGEADVDGVALRGDGTAVRRGVTYMPGEIAVYGELSGKRHLQWLLAGRRKGSFERALAIAGELGLPLERRVRGYSHGMKRQLFFAAAMAPRVRIRILDEPTEGLDPSKRAHVLDYLQRDAAAGVTVLLSSHHLGEVDRACDRMLFLKDGELLDEEAANALRDRGARVVRLRWSEAPNTAAVKATLAMIGVETTRIDGAEATLFLPEQDPRASLARLLERPELPRIESLVFGELSLHELYRELYGAEGV